MAILPAAVFVRPSPPACSVAAGSGVGSIVGVIVGSGDGDGVTEGDLIPPGPAPVRTLQLSRPSRLQPWSSLHYPQRWPPGYRRQLLRLNM
jgi:hypothetical protein